MPERPPFPGRPAQPPGKTFLTYSPDGTRLLVAGCGNYARSFVTNNNDEPLMIPDTHEDTLAVAAGNGYAILGCEDGTVCQYNVPEAKLEGILVRCTLPIRDVALSPDAERTWVAVCSDEIDVKLVKRKDMEAIYILKDHGKPVKHLSWDPSGKILAASCTDGVIYLYAISTNGGGNLYRRIDGVIPRLETTDDATSRCVWHPDGRAFACVTATREIVVISYEDGMRQRSFSGAHLGEITSIAWSRNGALLASASADDQLVIWETKTQKVLKRFNYEKILNVAWQNGPENIFNWTNSWGEVYIIYDFLKDPDHVKLLKGPKVRAPFFHDPLDETTAVVNGRKPLVNGQGRRAATPDSLDEMLRPDPNVGLDFDWIDDDDGAGYTSPNGNGKRTNGHLNEPNGHTSKRPPTSSQWQPQIHEPFQPGATPWRGNRKYLCLNLTGFVWTVDQETHNTITVEFYDREVHRDFHFTDPFRYDKACLNDTGTLFSCPGSNVSGSPEPAIIFYRPHEIWTGTRSDARIRLPLGEEVTCIALSERYIVAVTSVGYVRVWTLFGVPVSIRRMKSLPAVSCAADNSDHVMVVSNGGVAADGCTQLTYSIENIRSGEVCQNEDIVALGADADGFGAEDEFGEGGVSLKTLFWSEGGDPCIYDSNGVLCVLQGWRTPGQARWVPLLDTRLLDRLKDGKKEETYWPVAVAQDKFHCIILKGGDRYPYFPRPLLSEFDLRVPVNQEISRNNGGSEGEDIDVEETNASAGIRLEEAYVRSSTMLSLATDVAANTDTHSARTEVLHREVAVDKLLLQLVAVECREGEDRGMKALEVVSLMRDRGGKMTEAAAKIAGRYGRTVLEEKIRELGERRMGGMED